MPIPKHDDIRLPALQLLAKHESLKLKAFEKPLAEHFQLTDVETQQEYESGNGKIFYDRISWALSYLNMSGLVKKPKRGIYQISDEGRKQLQAPNSISLNHWISNKLKKGGQTLSQPITSQTPTEDLIESYKQIRQNVYAEIIDTILSKCPYEFEKLVVDLLQKMGYGGQLKASGEVTQSNNDKGIDGIIKEDVLGLGRIYIQAKRYAKHNTIGREEIQKFVGALAVAQSNKGVFITTSDYSKGAKEYAESLNGTTSLVLINGKLLADYIYEYGLGVQTKQIIELKTLDSDFWDAMQDA